MVEILTTYGMGAKTLSERMELSIEESQQIIDDFFKGFSGVDKFAKDSQLMARKYGYVTDIFGRKRHLPEAALPEFEFKNINQTTNFNPLLRVTQIVSEVPEEIKDKLTKQLLEVKKWKEKEELIEKIKAQGIEVIDNNSKISRAQRQTLNARIQGTAASMTKLAMIMIVNDEELKRLGFRLLITVHDEVFGECPTENAEAVGKRLCEVMISAAKVKCSFTNWSVDPYVVVDGWYEDEVITEISDKYKKQIQKGSSEEEALLNLQNQYTMLDKDSIKKLCYNDYEIGRDSLKYGVDFYKST